MNSAAKQANEITTAALKYEKLKNNEQVQPCKKTSHGGHCNNIHKFHKTGGIVVYEKRIV